MIGASILDISLDMTPGDVRAKICNLEVQMKKLENKFTEVPVIHLFPPGMYIRTVHLAKGSVIVGKLHKHAHGNIISQGRVSVITEFEPPTVYSAFCQFTSPRFTKRALVVHEDTIWSVIHPNPENITDLDEIEKMNIAQSYAELGMSEPMIKELESWPG